MELDKSIRNRIQKFVTHCRTLLTQEYTEQFQSIYGIQPDGSLIDVKGLTHLSQEEQTKAELLRQMIRHTAGAEVHSKKPYVKAIDQIIREQAFTTLNRFASLRMCEEREIAQESIRKGYESKGFKLFQTVCGTGIGDIHKRYDVYLKSIFDELSLDLGILFDRFSPMGMLFPGENTLLTLLDELNSNELEGVWQEDETIGWIYQYFNSKEERKKMRDESPAPRNSRELAVRNQFFTPRYVVQFLTDNTLGRIWYEMTQGKTVIKDICDYMVRRPHEIFLKKGDEPPPGQEEEEEKSQEELLKEPDYIPYRQIKDPREILMLDPACGSMHFGLYAFDLFEAIYEEAWDRYPDLLCDIREQVKTKEAFLRLIPDLIIRHNIHGIDIDRRAVQIAGLSLWLRAQKSYQKLNIHAYERPRITKSNIVCAEPMPGEKDLLNEFTKHLKPAVLGDLVSQIWEKMKLAGEAGSLLKIEEEIEGAIKKAKTAWNVFVKDMGGKDFMQKDIFVKEKDVDIRGILGYDITDIERLEDWEDMEALLLKALADFAEKGTGNGYMRKLFAEDAAHGFAFIDVCRKKYDVVLMNPPFGEVAKESKGYIQKNYPRTKNDLYAAFVERGLATLNKGGRFGAITSRTGFFLSSFTKWREEILLKEAKPTVFADLGYGIMDAAMVEAAAYCLEMIR
jgi:hypothetical protein